MQFRPPITRPSNLFLLKNLFSLVFGFPESKLLFFFHNCHILKPELLLPKTTTVQFVNSCGFKKQHFWFKDVTVVDKRCVVLIPESQKLKEKRFLRRNKLEGLVIGGLNCISQYKNFGLETPFNDDSFYLLSYFLSHHHLLSSFDPSDPDPS